MKQSNVREEGPITVIVSRIIKPGREHEFEAWVKNLNHDSMQCEGYLGYNLIRPADHPHSEYVILFKFDNYDNMKQWKESTARANWLAEEEALDITVGEYQMRLETGLEYWFRTPQAASPPSRIKMAAITLLAMYPATYLIGAALEAVTQAAHPLLGGLVTTLVVVTLMTYAIMPTMTRLFSFWLYRSG